MKQLADSYITINKLEVAFEVMVRGGGGGATGSDVTGNDVTGSHVTGRDMTGSMVCACATGSRAFFLL